VINPFLDDFVRVVQPRRCRIVGSFTPRGCISTTITAVHEATES